jgi:RNA recognition motif-containing protein
MKMESNTQPMNQLFIHNNEEQKTRVRENTSLEKKLLEKSYPELEKSQSANLPTCVIHVKGLDVKEMKMIFLINLFSNFGNVKKIIFFKDIGVALIEFTLREFAGFAITYLNEQMFLGSELQV